MPPPTDPDADLLARFAALKAPSTAPGSTDASLAAAKAAADAEDAFLARIAAGKAHTDAGAGDIGGDDPSGNLSSDTTASAPPPPPSSHPTSQSSLAGSQAVSGSGRVGHDPQRAQRPTTTHTSSTGTYAPGVPVVPGQGARASQGDEQGKDVSSGGPSASLANDEAESLLDAIRNSLKPYQPYQPAADSSYAETSNKDTPFSNARPAPGITQVRQARGDRGGSEVDDEIAALRRDLDPENDRRRNLALEVSDALKVADGARRRASMSRDKDRDVDRLQCPESDGGADEPEETEDEIVQRALEEARLEARAETESGSGSRAARKRSDAGDDTDDDGAAGDGDGGDAKTGKGPAAARHATAGGNGSESTTSSSGAEALLSLPSLSSLPDPPSDDAPLSAEEQARMAALLGLKGPSAFPAPPKKAPGGGPGPAPTSFPGMDGARDEDLHSWCGEYEVAIWTLSFHS